MFRTVPLSIIRSFSLYTQQWCMSYRFAANLRAGSGRNRFPARKLAAKPVWHITLLCVQWKTPDDGQRNCPKHVEFYSKIKFEKSVHLIGSIIKSHIACYIDNNVSRECAVSIFKVESIEHTLKTGTRSDKRLAILYQNERRHIINIHLSRWLKQQFLSPNVSTIPPD